MPGALDHIASDPSAASVYQGLLNVLDGIGSFTVEPGNGSVLVRNGRACLGVHPRRRGLLLNIVLARALRDERVVKVEKISRERFHNEILLTSPAGIDAGCAGWVAEASALSEAD